MTETAGWFAGQLPPRVAARLMAEDAREAVESRRSSEAREFAAEQWRDRNMAMAREQAEARGEVISAMALATGQVPGRTVADIFRSALAASEREDAVDAARLHRYGHGEPEKLHVFVGDPVIHHARSETGLRLANRYRRWKDAQDKRRAAEEAEAHARYEVPLARTVELNREREPQPLIWFNGRPVA
jgi:hypothetical protein